MMGPRMAQALLYGGTATVAHVQTIIGLMNLTSVLVTGTRNQHLLSPIEVVQKFLTALTPNEEGAFLLDDPDKKALLSAVLRQADSLLSLQTNGALLRALDYMDRLFLQQQADKAHPPEAGGSPAGDDVRR